MLSTQAQKFLDTISQEKLNEIYENGEENYLGGVAYFMESEVETKAKEFDLKEEDLWDIEQNITDALDLLHSNLI